MAAHEGSDHAEECEQHGIGEATFEQPRADAVRLRSKRKWSSQFLKMSGDDI